MGKCGLVHGENTLGPDPLQQAGDGRITERKPVALCGEVDIAKSDLLGRNLKPGTAMGTLALFYEPALLEEKKATTNHHSAL